MDRNIVYPGSIPLDTDLLALNRNTMIGLGFLAQAILGTNAVADGLQCQPTSPGSMNIVVGPGSITQFGPVDVLAYGSLPADSAGPIVKMGITRVPTTFSLTAPSSVGQSINYLIEATFQEADGGAVVLPYYNASNPAQSFSGPDNSGTAQNTVRSQNVQLRLKPGVPGNTGSQTTPLADGGWVGLYQITVAYGQTQVTGGNIAVIPTAPFLTYKLPSLRPGFGSDVKSFPMSGTFIVPPGVTQVEVEVWGAGSGSFASVPGLPSGGGSGGGYARKVIKGLTPGQSVPVTVGAGGIAGTTAGLRAGGGGNSSFGSFVSATGGSVNHLSQENPSAPQNGATPPGYGVNGDVNLWGSAGQAAIVNQGGMGQGGMGGACAMGGGAQNSGTTANAGTFPGGGAAGAGTGATGNDRFDGAAGGGGLVVVRW